MNQRCAFAFAITYEILREMETFAVHHSNITAIVPHIYSKDHLELASQDSYQAELQLTAVLIRLMLADEETEVSTPAVAVAKGFVEVVIETPIHSIGAMDKVDATVEPAGVD
jgi:phosphate starvation-inducible membrane PsiE